jgi:hypothetical protein
MAEEASSSEANPLGGSKEHRIFMTGMVNSVRDVNH